MSAVDLLFTGAGFSSTPARRALLLRLARADGQPWTDDQEGSGWTDHMAEVMYGPAADVTLSAMADAWDEGHAEGCVNPHGRPHLDDNPYRVEAPCPHDEWKP